MSEPKSIEAKQEPVPIARATENVCGPEEAMTCLLGVTQELNAAEDLDAGLARVAEIVRVYVPYETFGVFLLNDFGTELHFAYGAGFPAEVVNHWRFGIGQGLVGTAAGERRAVVAGNVDRDARYISAAPNVRSEIALPLVAKDRVIGVLDIGSASRDFFSPQDQQLLGFLAEHLAGAIEGARLYQNMRQQARTLSLLHELSRELTSILDRRQLLKRVAERLRRLIDFDSFGVMLWNEEKQVLEPVFGVDRDGRKRPRGESLPLGHGICGTAAALGQSLRVPNVHLDPRYVACSPDFDVRSELAVPLMFKGGLIGVVDLESASYNAFSQQHQQLVSTLGSTLAIALENARLYEKLRLDEERLEQDLSTAREVQKQLLPKQMSLPAELELGVGYEPARHLGGDFYDVLPYDSHRIAFALGDVAGKATSAALYGSLAVGTLRELAGRSHDAPAKILVEMNDKLGQLEFANRFVAMTFALYDSETSTVTLANSGLPFPYVLRGRRVERIDLGGVPLGLLHGQQYQEVTIRLEPGDALIMASDGIEESLDADGQEFGRRRLEGALQRLAGEPAQKLAEGLLSEACRFSGSARSL